MKKMMKKRRMSRRRSQVRALPKGVAKVLKNGKRLVSSAAGAGSAEVALAVHAAVETGGNLAHAARGILVRVLRRSRHTGQEALKTLGRTSQQVIRQTSRRSGNAAQAARGLVRGALLEARKLRLEAGPAARSVARAALKAAEKAGSATAREVRGAVAGLLDEVKTNLKTLSRS